MKKLLIMLLLALVLSGCSGSGEKLDLDIGPKAKTPEEIKADGNPFVYYEYEGKEIPVLTRPLLINDEYYVTKLGQGFDILDYGLVPAKFILSCTTQSSIYGEDGDPIKHEPLVLYVQVIPEGWDVKANYIGYLKNSGNIFVEGNSSCTEDWNKESLFFTYTIVRDVGFIGVDYGYLPGDGGEAEMLLGGCIFNAKTKEVIEKYVSIDTTSRYVFSEIPEYKNETVKDKKEIVDDLSNKFYCIYTNEHWEDTQGYLLDRYYTDERKKILDVGFLQEPVSLYVTPEYAYLYDFKFNIEEHSGVFYTRTLSKDGNTLYFDEDWRLSSFENDEIQAEYIYQDNYVEINIKDLNSGKTETIKYDF